VAFPCLLVCEYIAPVTDPTVRSSQVRALRVPTRIFASTTPPPHSGFVTTGICDDRSSQILNAEGSIQHACNPGAVQRKEFLCTGRVIKPDMFNDKQSQIAELFVLRVCTMNVGTPIPTALETWPV